MNEYFQSRFNRQPIEVISGDYYFGSDNGTAQILENLKTIP